MNTTSAQTMKIPANGATRLSKEAWINAEALKRSFGSGSLRKAVEACLDKAVTDRLSDPEFIKIFQQVKSEGVEN
jgi:hypothetical protein